MSDGLVFTYRGAGVPRDSTPAGNAIGASLEPKGSALWDGGEGIRAQAVRKAVDFTQRCCAI